MVALIWCNASKDEVRKVKLHPLVYKYKSKYNYKVLNLLT